VPLLFGDCGFVGGGAMLANDTMKKMSKIDKVVDHVLRGADLDDHLAYTCNPPPERMKS
jgi:hypothetical protein